MIRWFRWPLALLIAYFIIAGTIVSAQVYTTECPHSWLNQLASYAADTITIAQNTSVFLTSTNVVPTIGSALGPGPAVMVAVTNNGPGTVYYTLSGTAAVPSSGAGGDVAAGTTVYVCGSHAASAFQAFGYKGAPRIYSIYYRVR